MNSAPAWPLSRLATPILPRLARLPTGRRWTPWWVRPANWLLALARPVPPPPTIHCVSLIRLRGVARTDAFFNFKINVTGGNNFIGSGKLDGNGIPANFFSDIHVRKAFAYCFDWDTYIKDVEQGYGTQANDVMLIGMIGNSDKTPKYTMDTHEVHG